MLAESSFFLLAQCVKCQLDYGWWEPGREIHVLLDRKESQKMVNRAIGLKGVIFMACPALFFLV